MTALMTDARATLSPMARASCDKGTTEDILFADDTLLISNSGEHIQEYMAAVEHKGRDYGLEVHWGKVHLVKIGSDAEVRAPTGERIQPTDSMMYLGTTIHSNGKFGCEVGRKIGAARAEFEALSAIWKSMALAKAGRRLHGRGLGGG